MFTSFLLFVCCFLFVDSSSIHAKNLEKFIDRQKYTIKSVATTYTQHVSNHGQCMVEFNDEDGVPITLTEDETVKIKDKWFKVESCRLNRAYLASCGSKLLLQMLNVVCSFVEQHYGKKTVQQRQAANDLTNRIDASYDGICCKTACTISDLVQYCPLKW